MYSFFFSILHILAKRAEVGILCAGQKVMACKEDSSYQRNIERIVRLETRVLKHTEYASPSTMEKIQLSRIRRILASASTIPFWKNSVPRNSVLFRGVHRMKELEELPVLQREDVRTNFANKRTLNEQLPKRRRVLAQTSGSTGEPLFFYLDTIVIPGRRARFRRKIRWLVGKRRVFIAKAMGAVPLGFLNFRDVYFFLFNSAQNINISLFDFFELLRGKFASKTEIIIDTFPSNVIRFLQLKERNNFDGTRILGFVCGGEALLPGEREYISKSVGCEARSYYASTEFEIIGQECGQHPEHAFHINAEYFYIEILDKNGKQVPEGNTGRVVITSLEQEIMPFLRYDTGDLGRTLTEQCPCGRTLPLLQVEGRQANLIKLPNGKTFTQFSIISIFYDAEFTSEIRQFQIIHETPLSFTIEIVPHDAASISSQDRLKMRLSKILGDDVEVSIKVVKQIESTQRGKRVGYISKV